MSDDKLPIAIRTDVLRICGVELRCHVLDNGQRVIDAESLNAFFGLMSDDDSELSEEDIATFARLITNGGAQ